MFCIFDDFSDFLEFLKMLLIASVIMVVVIGGLGALIIVSSPDVVSEKTFTDTVTVESVYYVPSRTTTTYAMSGKVMVPITNTVSSEYNTTFNYKGESFKVDDYAIYEECKNLVNKEVTCEPLGIEIPSFRRSLSFKLNTNRMVQS